MPERGFWIFFSIFFQNFHALVKFEPNSGLIFFFFLFLGQSHPVLAKNNARKWFFNFSFFFCYFVKNFLARVEYERNSGLKFFSRFLSQSLPVLAKNNAGKRFFNFLIFLLFFSELSCPGRGWTEFGTKISSLFLV